MSQTICFKIVHKTFSILVLGAVPLNQIRLLHFKSIHSLWNISCVEWLHLKFTPLCTTFWFNLHIQIPPTGYIGLIWRSIAVATAGVVPLRVLWGYSDTSVTEAAYPVAADPEYPHSTLNSTAIFSSHIGTALYETHVAGQEESGCDITGVPISCGSVQ